MHALLYTNRVLERIETLSTKIAGNKIKIKTLAGQEHTIAYQKSMEEVSHLEYDLGFLREQVDVETNTEGRGGLEGLFRKCHTIISLLLIATDTSDVRVAAATA
jgi:hypothetical protein